MCGGMDTGYDEIEIRGNMKLVIISDALHEDYTKGLMGVDFSKVELIALSHAAEQIGLHFGASMTELKIALADLATAFQEPKKDLMLDLYSGLEMLRLDLIHRDDWPRIIKDDPQPRIRLSRIRPSRANAISCPPRVRRRTMDSRSGLKGRTTRRKMGKQ